MPYAILVLVFCALFSLEVFADCRVLDQQEMIAKTARMTGNAYLSGALLGTSIGLFLVNALLFAFRTRRWGVTLFAFGVFSAVVMGFFFVEVDADAECGESLGGINPLYYLILLIPMVGISFLHVSGWKTETLNRSV